MPRGASPKRYCQYNTSLDEKKLSNQWTAIPLKTTHLLSVAEMSNNHKTRYVNSLVHRQIRIRGSWAISDRALERAGLRERKELTSGTLAISIGIPANLGVTHWWYVHQQSVSVALYVTFVKLPVMVP